MSTSVYSKSPPSEVIDCLPMTMFGIDPQSPDDKNLLSDPDIRKELQDFTDISLIPTEIATHGPDENVIDARGKARSLLERVTEFDIESRDMHDLTQSLVDLSSLVERAGSAKRLLSLKGLGCVSCTAAVICPIKDRLEVVTEETSRANDIISDAKSLIDGLVEKADKELVKQGVVVPTPDELIKIYEGLGFKINRQTNGSHIVLKKFNADNTVSTAIVASHAKQIPTGTFLSGLRLSGVALPDYIRARNEFI